MQEIPARAVNSRACLRVSFPTFFPGVVFGHAMDYTDIVFLAGFLIVMKTDFPSIRTSRQTSLVSCFTSLTHVRLYSHHLSYNFKF